MTFSDNIKRFSAQVQARNNTVFVNTAAHALRSIQDGSPTTSAPGQPVAEGILKASFQLAFPSPTLAEITTNVPWAPSNEDGIARPGGGPYIQRSAVGGRWSIRLTIAGIPKIVAYETALVVGGAGGTG